MESIYRSFIDGLGLNRKDAKFDITQHTAKAHQTAI